eukprot:510738_1
MGQCCAVKAQVIELLHYELENTNETDEMEVTVDTKAEIEKKRIIYERQLSKEINNNYIRETRQELLYPIIQNMYIDLNIPFEILDLILDFEQSDSLNEIFKLFDKLKTKTICNIYIIPYILGWIEMLICGYLASEYWEGIEKTWHHLLLLQIFGIILSLS